MIDFGRIVQMRERKLVDHQRAEKRALVQLAAAVTAVDRSKAAMRAYAAEVSTIEGDMLAELVGKEIKIDDIHKIEEKLREVKTKAEALAAAHADAKQAQDAAEVQHAQTRLARANAEAKFNKISEIDKILIAEKAVEVRAAEDAEMDSFVDLIAGRGQG